MKVELNDVASLTNETSALSTINTNNNSIENAVENTLSRDGTGPNQMEAQLDMNSNRIINLPNPTSATEPLRLQDLADFLGTGIVSTIPGGGTAGQVLMKDTATDYDASWQTPKPDDIFYLSNYATLQDACDATVSNGGGIVFCDRSENLSGAVGLSLDNWITPLKIVGYTIHNGGAGYGSVIAYTGTGTAISATTAVSVVFEGLYITATQGNTTLINLGTAVNCRVSDCVLYHQTADAGNVAIRLGGSGDQGTVIEKNTFVPNGGTGIIGVSSAFSVAAQIHNNKFTVTTLTGINAPGNAWRITGNIFQGNGNVNQKFMTAGPAGTCDTVYLNGNDIDDGTFANTWITSNAGCLISINNRYTGTSTTAISQTNSTGAVISIGDYFQGSVGVAIGTGNYLSITNPNQQAVPAQYFTGTPASSRTNHIFGSIAQITSQLVLGIGGTTQGSTRFLNTAVGSNSNTIVTPNTAHGNITQTLPDTTGTIVNTTNGVTLQNKVIDTTDTVAPYDVNFSLLDNADQTKILKFEASGIATGTTRTLTAPNANGTIVLNDNTATLTNKTIDTFTMSGVAVSRGQFPGVNGATDATAGNIGEYVEATNTGVVLTTGTQTTVVTLNIPSAGDWDISAKLFFSPAATTSVTRFNASISTITNSFQTGNMGQYVDNPQAAFVSGGNTFNAIIPTYRVKVAGPTTYYIVALPAFTVSTLTGSGIATARRAH